MSDDLLENYQRAYANKAGFGKKPVLILVDFAHAYFDKDCDLYAGVDDALASALRVRERGARGRRPGGAERGALLARAAATAGASSRRPSR